MSGKQTLLCICAFLILCCGGLAQAADPAKTLRIAVDVPYPPFASQDKDGKLSGFDVDIAHAICEELGYTCDVQGMLFNAIIPSIVAGEIDLGIAGMIPTEERKKLVDFTNRYFRSVSIFVERRGTFEKFNAENVKGTRVGAQTGTVQAKYLEDTYGDSITLITVDAHDQTFQLLKNRDVDLILIDGLPAYAYLKSPQGQDLEIIGNALTPGGTTGWSCVAVTKEKPWLRDKVNQAIDTLRRNGKYGKINRKYFDFTIY
jgi:ABC-type amino acid transport/signal transduction systems, periplasmic component/domain